VIIFLDADPVPAIGGIGLGVMLILLLAGGAMILNKRYRQAA